MKVSLVTTEAAVTVLCVIALAFKASKAHTAALWKTPPSLTITPPIQPYVSILYRDIYTDFEALWIMVSGIGDVFIIQI
jgi:hypothetical protein